MKYSIDQLRQVKGIGEKTIQRIIEQLDAGEYLSEYDPSKHIDPNSLVHGDMLEVMNGIPDKSIDLIITSPPYDNLRSYNSSFNVESLINNISRVITDDGVIVWVVGDSVVDGGKTLTSFEQALKFKELGFKIYDVIIYHKTSPSPPHKNRYFNSFEYMFVLTKNKPKTVNLLKDRLNKSFGKNTGVISRREKDGSLTKKEGKVINKYGLRTNIWTYDVGFNKMATNNIAHKHPAIFPESLVQDHILSWSNEGDIVLDMMMGSGTVPNVAKKMGRKYIGIELDKEYYDIAVKRVGDIENEQL